MADTQKSLSPLVVGAGPTGLVTALWLARSGVRCRIIDKNSGPGEFSRAIAVQARTLELYRQLGIADQFVEEGILVQNFTLRRRGKVVTRAPIGALGEGISPFPYLLFHPQDEHEKILLAHLRELGIEVEYGTELVGLTQDPNSVRTELRSARGSESFTASHVCGCDGAHSGVRHALGIGFPGGTYEQVFFVADVVAHGPMAEEGGVQVSVSEKDFCIVMPLRKQGSVRLIGIVPQEKEKLETLAYSDVSDAVNASTGLSIEGVNWFSRYRVHHRVAEQFRVGRVFLAGDAAHIHSPAGGQGMNTGIGDAVNLAWKLAAVIQGRASESLLDTYEPERHAFAKTLVATTDRAFQVIASRTRIGSYWRANLLPYVFTALTSFGPTLRAMFRLISQVRIHYPESALSEGSAGSLRAGDRLPYLSVNGASNYDPLRSLDWQAHVYGRILPRLRNWLDECGFHCHEFAWSGEAANKGFVRDAVYLVRPDGYLGFVSSKQNVAMIERYVAKHGLKSNARTYCAGALVPKMVPGTV